jgi:hypothetical protein
MRAAKEMLGAVQDGGEAETQRPEARVLERQLGVVELGLGDADAAEDARRIARSSRMRASRGGRVQGRS